MAPLLVVAFASAYCDTNWQAAGAPTLQGLPREHEMIKMLCTRERTK